MKAPTKKLKGQWKALLERYAASGDAEQNMVVDIVNYLGEQLEQAEQRSDQNFRTCKTVIALSKSYQQAYYDLVHARWRSKEQSRSTGSKGGKAYAPYKKIDDLALELYREDPEQSAEDIATYICGIFTRNPEQFRKEHDFPADREVNHRTVRDNLLKNLKEDLH